MSIRLGSTFLAGTPDITGKANTSADNFSNTGKSTMAGFAMPSDTFEDLTILASGQKYTAPANGYFASRSNGQIYIAIYNPNSTAPNNEMMSSWLPITGSAGFMPVKKGQQVVFGYNIAPEYFRFIYANGSESEAS